MLGTSHVPANAGAQIERPGTPGFTNERFVAYERGVGMLHMHQTLAANPQADRAHLERINADLFLDSVDHANIGDADIDDVRQRAAAQRQSRRIVQRATGALSYLHALESPGLTPPAEPRLVGTLRGILDRDNLKMRAYFYDPQSSQSIHGRPITDRSGYDTGYALSARRAAERDTAELQAAEESTSTSESEEPASIAAQSHALDAIHGLHDIVEFIPKHDWESFCDEFFTALHKLDESHFPHQIQRLQRYIAGMADDDVRLHATAKIEDALSFFELENYAARAV